MYDCLLCDEHVKTYHKLKDHIAKHLHDIEQMKHTLADLK